MKYILSAITVCICYFPEDALSGKASIAYQIAPTIVDVSTEPLVPANWYFLYDSSNIYYPPDPIGKCYRVDAINEWVAEDPEHHSARMEDPNLINSRSPCKLCSSPELRIGIVNGAEVCYGNFAQTNIF